MIPTKHEGNLRLEASAAAADSEQAAHDLLKSEPGQADHSP